VSIEKLPAGVRKENVQSLLAGAVAPTKAQLSAYWKRVGKEALRFLRRRPLRLVRSVGGLTFYHGGPLPPVSTAVHQIRTETRQGGVGTRLWVDSVAGLLGLVEIDVVEVHPWGATVDDIERPDVLTFNLIGGKGVAWEEIVQAAFRLRELLAAERLKSWPKLTGELDLHVMADIEPVMDWVSARNFCKALADKLARTAPARFTLRPGPANRVRRIYIDYLRNGRGSTAVGAYSPRALRGFPVAAPVTWSALEKGIAFDAYTLDSPPKSPRRPVRVGARRAAAKRAVSRK
jgi:bifunctional non-homologous end joining protein LigD